MVTDFIRARNVLVKRLEAVFAPETFAALYPESGKAPRVFLGFPVTEPPFYAAVDEIVDVATTDGAATMGHDTVRFTLHVWLSAQHSELEAASNALLAYVDAVFGSVMADPRMNGSVDNAFAKVESAGTAADSSKRYIAAALVGVECTAWSACPAQLAEVVAASNEAFDRDDETADEEAANAGDGD